MPEDPAIVVVIVLELALVFGGLVALWRFVASPAARLSREPPHLAVWNVTWVDILLFIWYVVLFAFLFNTGTVVLLQRWEIPSEDQMLYAGFAFQLGMLVGCLAYRYLRPRRPTYDFADPAPEAKRPFPLQAGFLTFVVSIPILMGVSLLWRALLQGLGFPVEEQELVNIFATEDSPGLTVLLLVFAIVIAPITEELIFRKALFRFARQNFSRWIALLAPSLLFAALHQNLASFLPLVALGVIYSLAYERTGRIGVPIIAHGLFNLHSIVLILLGATGL